MRADKVRKTDSVWDDDRIQNFLNRPSMGQETGDYSRLLFAYRSIRRKDCWRSVGALPANAQAYIRRVEEAVGAPVDMISTGPDRKETIVLNDPFA